MRLIRTASTSQGGSFTTGSRVCVEGWENSWQGGTMSRKISSPAEEEDFLVVIEGWDCDKQEPLKRREVEERSISDDLSSGTNSLLTE